MDTKITSCASRKYLYELTNDGDAQHPGSLPSFELQMRTGGQGSEAKRRGGSLTPPWKCPVSARNLDKELARRDTRDRYRFVLAAALVVLGGIAAAQDKPNSLTVGQRLELTSTVLNEKRDVWVALPSGYENGRDRYPVVVQLGDLSHFRYSVPIVDLLSGKGHLPRHIVVGLPDPTPRHHYRDSTPTKVDYLPASGGAANFLAFLKNELVPYIDSRFRTEPFRIVCGHGLSGLFIVWALKESAGTFGAAITDSASLTYDNSFLLEEWAARPPAFVKPAFLYLAAGDERETLEGLQRLAAQLKKNPPAGLDWTIGVEKDEDQGTVCVQAFYKGLKWIYRDWRLPVATATRGIDSVKTHFAGLSQRFGYSIPVTENVLSVRGFQLIGEQKFEDAARIFNLSAKTYPDSYQVYQNLGFLYERMKDAAKAAAAYEQAAEKAASSQPDLAKYFRMQADRLRKTIIN
jgi:predicted alpha/beta superfamily hydrolase